MAENYYQFDRHHGRHRFIRRLKWFIAGLFIAVPVIIVILFFTTSVFIEPEAPPATSGVQTSVQAPSTKIFRTVHFQFQASNTWTEDAKETTANKFVYRSFRGPIIEHDMTIYVNPSTTQFDATRIQPVIPQPDGTLKDIEGISEHCDTSLPPADKDREQTVKFHGVTFICDADDTIFDVLVGKVEGSPFIDLVRPDDSTARYLISYRDLTAAPTGRELREIVRSFQTR